MSTSRDFRVGQRITLQGNRYQGNGVVVKILPKNVEVRLDGSTGVIRAHPSFLAPEGATPPAAEVTAQPYAPVPPTGTLVRFNGNDSRITGLFVVIGEGFQRGRTVAKIARLGGGDAGRYWNVPAPTVTPVPLEDVVKTGVTV